VRAFLAAGFVVGIVTIVKSNRGRLGFSGVESGRLADIFTALMPAGFFRGRYRPAGFRPSAL
jgi:hypothetical protein